MNKNILAHLITAASLSLILFFFLMPIGGRIFWEDSYKSRYQQFQNTEMQQRLQEEAESTQEK